MNKYDKAFLFGISRVQEILQRKINTAKRQHKKIVPEKLLDEAVLEAADTLYTNHNIHGRKDPLLRDR